MPKKNYDNTVLGKYIRALENPDSLGYRNGKWYASPYDANARGFGVDIVKNKEAAKVASGREGMWLTEQEERDIRNGYIEHLQDVIDRKHLPYLRKNGISDYKRMAATGLLYRGDGINSSKQLSNAYYNGTDEDFKKAVDTYYKSKNLPERARLHSNFDTGSTPKAKTIPSAVEVLEGKRMNTEGAFGKKYNDGGPINPWNRLTQYQKADIMKLAIGNGIYNLDNIKSIYNEYAEGGNITPP